MRPSDPYKAAAEALKYELIAVALLLAGLYLIRLEVVSGSDELDEARRAKARAELDLDGALETISRLKNGDDEPTP